MGLVPSKIAILLRNTNRFVEAKTHWSVRTRAAMVALGERKLILRWRNANQVVAAGPKMALRGEKKKH